MHPMRYREIRWLASQVRPFLRLHLFGYFCVVITSILVLLDPLIIRFLIDDVIPRRRLAAYRRRSFFSYLCGPAGI